MFIARVREVNCDGNKQGRTWSERFFKSLDKAEGYQNQLIDESNKKNPRNMFNKEIECVDSLYGYCNWQYGIMITIDKVFVDWE
jgi:hypothetical protein